jgi:acetamidase/formamidase
VGGPDPAGGPGEEMISEIVDAPNWIVSAFLPETIFTP